MGEIIFMQAVTEAMREEFRRDPHVFILGEDVRAAGLGSTVGFLQEFGPDRVLDTPISESGFIGVGVGAALVGMRPIVEISIASFLYVAMDQIISMAAKCMYMYGGQAKLPLTIRTNLFYNSNNAAQHSDRPYSMFMNVPGLKIIAPSTPYDMKGLLKAAIRDDGPVMSFEDSKLWFTKGIVPDEDYVLPIGKGDIKREGRDVTIVGVAGGVAIGLAAAAALEKEGISAEVVDPRSLVPLDKELILESVKKTGHLVVVDPAHRTCSAASEIAAIVAEEGFGDLKGPIQRVTTDDVQPPFSPSLEPQIYPTAEKVIAAVHRTAAESLVY